MAAENGVGESHGARPDAASMRPRRMAAENVGAAPGALTVRARLQ